MSPLYPNPKNPFDLVIPSYEINDKRSVTYFCELTLFLLCIRKKNKQLPPTFILVSLQQGFVFYKYLSSFRNLPKTSIVNRKNEKKNLSVHGENEYSELSSLEHLTCKFGLQVQSSVLPHMQNTYTEHKILSFSILYPLASQAISSCTSARYV